MVNPKLIIFGTLAIGAAVAAAVTAAWAGYKTAEVVREKKPETKKETFKETWKYWMPTAGCLGAAIVADVCLIKFGLAAASAIAGVVSVSMANRKKIMEKMKKTMNSEEFKKWKKEFVGETVKERYVVKELNIQDTGYGDTLCYFEIIDKWFRSNPMEVQKALNEFKYSVGHNDVTSFLQLIEWLHLEVREFEEYCYKDLGWFQDRSILDDASNYNECEMVEGFAPGFPEETYVITTWYAPYCITKTKNQVAAA